MELGIGAPVRVDHFTECLPGGLIQVFVFAYLTRHIFLKKAFIELAHNQGGDLLQIKPWHGLKRDLFIVNTSFTLDIQWSGTVVIVEEFLKL